MATSGKPLDQRTSQAIRDLRQRGVSVRETAKRLSVSTRTVQVHQRCGKRND